MRYAPLSRSTPSPQSVTPPLSSRRTRPHCRNPPLHPPLPKRRAPLHHHTPSDHHEVVIVHTDVVAVLVKYNCHVVPQFYMKRHVTSEINSSACRRHSHVFIDIGNKIRISRHFGNISATFPAKLLTSTFKVQIQGPLSRSTFEVHFRGPHLRSAFEVQFQGPLLRSTFEGHFRGQLSRSTFEVHFRRTLSRAACQVHFSGPLSRSTFEIYFQGTL